jgi:DNA-binding transcriptional ArsR family regulator
MSTAPTTTSATVVPLHPQTGSQPEKNIDRKWGKDVAGLGYTSIPSLLLLAPRRLGLSPTQLAIVVVLADYWWAPENQPWPSKADICDRIGLKPRQLQRHIAEMEDAGLIKRVQRFHRRGGKSTNLYDLSGLVAKLKALAPEFKQAKEDARARRKVVSIPLHLRPPPATPV